MLKLSFTRTAVTGAAATVVDFGVLIGLVQWVGISPEAGNVPALVAGSLVQFLGNRNYAFRAGRQGILKDQLVWFVFAELGAMGLTATAFHWVVHYHLLNYVIARAVVNLSVFGLFSYPLWRYIFQTRSVKASASKS